VTLPGGHYSIRVFGLNTPDQTVVFR
jgi:hypothetical protein